MAAITRYSDMITKPEHRDAIDHHLRSLADARQVGAAARAAILNMRGGNDFSPLHDPIAEREAVSERFLHNDEFRDKLLQQYRDRPPEGQPAPDNSTFQGHGGVPDLREQLRGLPELLGR